MAQWRTPSQSPDIHQLIQEIRSSVITSTWTFSNYLGENYGECCLMHVSCVTSVLSHVTQTQGNNDNRLSHDPRGGGCQQHLMMVTSHHHQPHCILMTHLCRTKNTAVSADSALGSSLCDCYKYSAPPTPAPVEL